MHGAQLNLHSLRKLLLRSCSASAPVSDDCGAPKCPRRRSDRAVVAQLLLEVRELRRKRGQRCVQLARGGLAALSCRRELGQRQVRGGGGRSGTGKVELDWRHRHCLRGGDTIPVGARMMLERRDVWGLAGSSMQPGIVCGSAASASIANVSNTSDSASEDASGDASESAGESASGDANGGAISATLVQLCYVGIVAPQLRLQLHQQGS